MKLTRILAGAVLAAGLVAADGAQALEIVQTRTFAKGADAGFAGMVEMAAVANLALDPFDPTLGTLGAVRIQFQATMDGKAVGEFWDVPDSFDLVPHVGGALEYRWWLLYDLPHFDQPTGTNVEILQDVCEDTADFPLANASCDTAVTPHKTFSEASELVDAGDLAAYVGTDPLAVQFTGDAVVFRYNTTNDPQYGDGWSWVGVEGLLEVTYDYTPVSAPEPTTSALLGVALAAVGAARRARTRSARTRR